MRLHYHPLSPYSRKAAVAIALRGDAAELRSITLGAGELRSAAFLEISPFGKIPVLETAEGPLIESTSIIEYLEERGPRVLLPAGSERVARHFDRLGDLYLVAQVAQLWWEPDTEGGKEAPEVARRAWALFEPRVTHNDFVCGRRFTLGDLGAAIATDYFERLGVVPSRAIREWRRRCFAMPEMAESLEAALPFVSSTLGGRAHAVS